MKTTPESERYALPPLEFVAALTATMATTIL